ncbi:Protein phosphatase inhibitor 2, partial [Acipenser ruthenus]
RKKSQKWDEMNILATYHPADKDYGLMKIDEPSTPYHRMVGDDDEGAVSDSESNEAIAADDLAQKLAAAEGKDPKIFMREEEESSEEEDEELSPEEEAKKNEFEMKRKMHYNEGMNIKLARQLIATELQEDEEEEEEDYRDEEMKDETEDINIDPPQGGKSHFGSLIYSN